MQVFNMKKLHYQLVQLEMYNMKWKTWNEKSTTWNECKHETVEYGKVQNKINAVL